MRAPQRVRAPSGGLSWKLRAWPRQPLTVLVIDTTFRGYERSSQAKGPLIN